MEEAYSRNRLPARVVSGRRGRQVTTSRRSREARMLRQRGERLLRPGGEEDVASSSARFGCAEGLGSCEIGRLLGERQQNNQQISQVSNCVFDESVGNVTHDWFELRVRR